MRTIDQQSSTSPSLLALAARNARLLLRLATMVLDYWTVGSRVRREYRDKSERGDVYWLDPKKPA